VLTSSWTGVPNKVAGECIYIYTVYAHIHKENSNPQLISEDDVSTDVMSSQNHVQ